jgi:hypothetical protein
MLSGRFYTALWRKAVSLPVFPSIISFFVSYHKSAINEWEINTNLGASKKKKKKPPMGCLPGTSRIEDEPVPFFKWKTCAVHPIIL